MDIKSILEMMPDAEVIEQTELVHEDKVGDGPWRLYVYGRDNLHSGGKWFNQLGRIKYPDEEMPIISAKHRADEAIGKKLEVRICDGWDHLVFHSRNGEILFGGTFWNEVMPDPNAVAVANRLNGNK